MSNKVGSTRRRKQRVVTTANIGRVQSMATFYSGGGGSDFIQERARRGTVHLRRRATRQQHKTLAVAVGGSGRR